MNTTGLPKHINADEYAAYVALAKLKGETARDIHESWWQDYFRMKNTFYDRPLASFADETITTCRPNKAGDLWYAILDVGPKTWPADPDYSTCRDSAAAAIKDCADKIRANVETRIGGYDMGWRLKKHWVEKEGNK